jgi:hypothetical protein
VGVWECSERAAHGEPRVVAELEVAGAVEDEARVRKSEIGWAGEHKWVTAVL